MSTSPECLKIERAIVMPGRMRLEITMEFWTPESTNAALAADAIKLYPTICEHSCINSHGPAFGNVIKDTSITHLLEHMIIEEQLEIMSTDPRFAVQPVMEKPLVGTTIVARDKKTAVVEVSFCDDLICARAASRALANLNELLPCRPYLY